MSTLAGVALTVDAPFQRLSVPLDPRDPSGFYDATNRRYKSGFVASVLSALSLGGTFGAGDTLAIVVKPPNFNPLCGHTQARYNPTATGAVPGFASYTLNTAVNYGLPGPSARLEGDQTASFVDVELTLTPASNSSTSALTPTLTYTNTTTLIDPYSVLGGAPISSVLGVIPENDGHWSTVTYPVTAMPALAVQLTTMTSTVQQGIPAGSDSPLLQLSNVQQIGGQSICNVNLPLGGSASRVKTFYDSFTYVWAVNNSKVDANGTPIVRPSPGTIEWNLLNVGLSKSAMSGDKADLTLGYKINTY